MKNKVLYVLLCLLALQGSVNLVGAEAGKDCWDRSLYENMRRLRGMCFALENFNSHDDAHVKERIIRKKSKRTQSQAERMHLSQGTIEFDKGENFILVDENLLNKECISDWCCLQKCCPGTHCCTKLWFCGCDCRLRNKSQGVVVNSTGQAVSKDLVCSIYNPTGDRNGQWVTAIQREQELEKLKREKNALLRSIAHSEELGIPLTVDQIQKVKVFVQKIHTIEQHGILGHPKFTQLSKITAPAPQMMDAPVSGPAVPTSLAAAAALTPALSSAHVKKDSQPKSVSFVLQKTDSGTQTSPLGPVSLPGSAEVDAMPDAQPQQKQLRVATDSAVFFVPQGASPAARKLPSLPVVPRLPLAPDAVTPSQGQHGSPAHSFRLPHFNGGFTFTIGGKSVYEITPATTPAHHSKQSPAHSPLATSGSGRQAITIRVSSDDVLTVEKHSSKPSCSLTVDSAQGREHLPGLVEQAEPERPKSAASHHSLLSEASEA